MEKIRKYLEETFYLKDSDVCLNKLQEILTDKEKEEDAEERFLKKELRGLCALLKKEGYDPTGKKKRIAGLIVSAMKEEMETIDFRTYPLKMISFEKEIANQYRLVDLMHRHFDGYEALKEGDYGCHLLYGRPERTVRVEKVLAEYFESEDCALVRGGGTGAIRALCFALIQKGDRILVHDAPMYTTTKITLEAMDVKIVKADFNEFRSIEKALKEGIDVLYIQRVRQALHDRYDAIRIIEKVREIDPKVKIITDENYAVNKVRKLGSAAGADASAFSAFKLLGIPGIGIITGTKKVIEEVHAQNYSGGGQVQGPEASEVLRSLVNNPVLLAVQNASVDEIVKRLNQKEVAHVAKAIKANLEERIVLVRLDLPIAREVIEKAVELGALPHPVGSESRYEVQALFYRVAKVMLDEDPIYADFVIRINPMRSGPDTVIRILKEAIVTVLQERE